MADLLLTSNAEHEGSETESVVAESLREQEIREETRERRRVGTWGQISSYVLGTTFLVAALMLVALRPPGHIDLVFLATSIALYALAFRIDFEIGPGSAVPTQLAFIPMVLGLPLSAVPLAVAAGLLAGGITDENACKCSLRERPFVLLYNAWYSFGPVLVLLALDPGPPTVANAHVYALALLAQFALEFVASTLHVGLGLGYPLRKHLPAVAWIYAFDSLLSPVGVAASLAAGHSALAIGLVAAPLGALALLARERGAQHDRWLALRDVYLQAATRARLDPLTGLRNRLAWDEAIEKVVEQDADARLGVLLLDVNHLKRANDSRGHAFGDRLLSEVATVFARAAHEATVVARLGGDELAALFLGDAVDECPVAAARLRIALSGVRTLDGFALSAAVGTAIREPGTSIDDAFAAADERLYAHKDEMRARRVS